MGEGGSRHRADRRRFLDWLLGTSAASLFLAVAYPVVRYVIPPAEGESAASSVTLDIGPDDIGANTGRIFKFGSEPGLLVKLASGELRAFSATCTHLGCIVQYREDLTEIWCACHNGHFDLNGTNISGPPPAPLEQYDVNVRGSQIVVARRA
jgi:cytochrome b6-f complex iron-sulfur subunit